MINFSQIPPEFIEATLTTYQKESVEIKYHVYDTIKKSDDTNVNEICK